MDNATITPAVPRPSWSWAALWPPVAATILLLVLVGSQTYASIKVNNGHLIYPIDDAYGHMAIAKNLVRHWIWGFSALNGFSSACSSLIWPWLVAICYAATGPHECTLYVLNCIAAAGLLLYCAHVIRRYTASGWANFGILAAIVFFAPLPAVVASGMEHSLQALLSVVFVDQAILVLLGGGEEFAGGRRASRWLLLSAFFLVLTRYEGLFLVGIIGLLLLWRRHWKLAFLLGAVTGLPLALFGAYSMYKGWYPLPNSLLLKGNTTPVRHLADLATYFDKAQLQIRDNPHIYALAGAMLLGLAFTVRRYRTIWAGTPLLLLVTIVGTGLQLQYAAFGWFFRYEAYLMVLGLLALGIVLVGGPTGTTAAVPGDQPARSRGWLLPYWATLAAAVAWFGSSVVTRGFESLLLIKPASHNIYEQQFQLGLFLRHFYQGQGIVINDIGAVDYLGEFQLYDIFGLADIDVLRAKRANDYDHTLVEKLQDKYHAKVVAVFDTWAQNWGGQLPDWTPVGQWTLTDNVICGYQTVTFYAPHPSLIPELTSALQSFAPKLPREVVQGGLYRGGKPPPVLGTFSVEDDGIPYRWSNYSATYNVYPGDRGITAAADSDGILTLDVRAAGLNVQLEFIVNGEALGLVRPPVHPAPWTQYSYPVHLRAGLNTIKIIGHGTAVQPLHDARKIMFGTHPPLWTPVPKPTAPL